MPSLHTYSIFLSRHKEAQPGLDMDTSMETIADYVILDRFSTHHFRYYSIKHRVEVEIAR